MELVKYTNNENENLNIHIPFVDENVSPYPKILYTFLKNFLSTDIEQIIIGHEHGTYKKRCYLEVIVKFKKKLTRILNPGYLIINYYGKEYTLLFMQQIGRNSSSLAHYCTKGKKIQKFFYYNDDEKKKLYQNVFDDIINDLLQNNLKKYFISNVNFEKRFRNAVLPFLEPFKWVLPPKTDYVWKITIPDKDKRISFMTVFSKWFENYCTKVTDQNYKRKALCLYSKEKDMGKTWFAEHLVNDPGYILKYYQTFSEKPFKSYYKLLLLDNMKAMTSDNLYTWKRLVASEPINFRNFSISKGFSLSLPCIITTNDIKLVATFINDRLFNTQVVTIEIDECLMEKKFQKED